MKKIFLIALIVFLGGCDTMGLTGDGGSHKGDDTFEPTSGDNTEQVPIIIIEDSIPTLLEYGSTAEDWTVFFKVEDNIDGEITVTEKMLSWSPTFDSDTPGDYVLRCEYTNSTGTMGYSEIIITVKEEIPGENDEKSALIVEIESTEGKATEINAGSDEVMWSTYFTVTVNEVEVEVGKEHISFIPEIDMDIPGEYILRIDYIAEDGILYSDQRIITILGEISTLLKDIEPTSIYNVLMYNYSWDEVRMDGMQVVLIMEDLFISRLNEEYIVNYTYTDEIKKLTRSLDVGDLINVVGEIYMSNGVNIALGLYPSQIEIVTKGETIGEFNGVESMLEDVMYFNTIFTLPDLKKDIGVYDTSTKTMNGVKVLNDTLMNDGVSYEIIYLVSSNYTGRNPEMYVLQYTEKVESADPNQNQVFYYIPQWTAFNNGDEVEVPIRIIAALTDTKFVAMLDNNDDYYAYVMIIDTEGTPYEWIANSLVEGGKTTLDVVVSYEEDETGASFKVIPTAEPIAIYADSPAYVGKDQYIGEPYVVTPTDLQEELRYSNQDLGVFSTKQLENIYEMTAIYDSTLNTFGGFKVSELGVQLSEDGEYTVSFIFTKMLKEAPYGEILVLSPYYSFPTLYPLNNEFATIRTLRVASNNGDIIVAVDASNSFTLTIDITNNNEWDTIQTEDVINVVGQISSDGLSDTTIEVIAYEITIE